MSVIARRATYFFRSGLAFFGSSLVFAYAFGAWGGGGSASGPRGSQSKEKHEMHAGKRPSTFFATRIPRINDEPDEEEENDDEQGEEWVGKQAADSAQYFRMMVLQAHHEVRCVSPLDRSERCFPQQFGKLAEARHLSPLDEYQFGYACSVHQDRLNSDQIRINIDAT